MPPLQSGSLAAPERSNCAHRTGFSISSPVHPARVHDAADGHRHHDFMDSPTDSIAQSFTPAHAQLARSAGVPATLAAESYVEALARIVYYWGYPAVDTFGRTNMWEIMDGKTGLQLGLLPGAAKNYTGALTGLHEPGAAVGRLTQQRHDLRRRIRRSHRRNRSDTDPDRGTPTAITGLSRSSTC